MENLPSQNGYNKFFSALAAQFHKISFKSRIILLYLLAGLVFCLLFFFLFFSAPGGFPAGAVFTVETGDSLRSVSLKLKNENIIRSRLVFEAFVIIFGREKRVIGADYYFEKKLPVFEVARRISEGKYNMAPIAVTIPEGYSALEIADAFASKLPSFDKSNFLAEAEELEGTLFPDTYFFFSTSTEASVLASMKENFNKKMKLIRPLILSEAKITGRTESEIIIMASLIEGEANGDADRELISGILWKRIKMKMPLQVDAALETYKRAGLPENPIGNPGLKAIRAAIYPKESPYLYYLHDKEGDIHYARSFAEHRQNVVKYLK